MPEVQTFLVEAMYLGLNSIAFGVSFNLETTQNEALYFNNEIDLRSTLEEIENDPEFN